MSLLPGNEMEEPNLATELAEEVELLKKFARRSRQRIWKVSRQAGTILGQDGDITKLLNLLDQILSLPFTDVLTVATAEEALQPTISDPMEDTSRNDSHVDGGGVEADEEMCASPSPEHQDDDHFCNGNEENGGTTEQANLISGPKSMQPPFLIISKCRIPMVSNQARKSEGPTCSKTATNEKFLKLDAKMKYAKVSKNPITLQRPRFPCTFPGCGKTYLHKTHVSRHVRIEHTENSVRYPCTLCKKEFRRRYNLQNHHRTHTSEKPYKCATCGRSFTLKASLKLHEETHLEKRNRKIFQCHICPITFLQRNTLRKHITTIHENRRNYPCTFCDKRFSSSSDLKRHVEARHPTNQEPRHSCDQCEFKTHSKHYLTVHKKLHDPPKYECYFCGEKFFTFQQLARHCGRIHTLEKKCNLEFE